MEAKVLSAAGVVTTRLNSIEQKKATEENYTPVGIAATLWAGFFEYADDSVITMTSITNVAADGSEG